jgi:hypothetical protein
MLLVGGKFLMSFFIRIIFCSASLLDSTPFLFHHSSIQTMSLPLLSTNVSSDAYVKSNIDLNVLESLLVQASNGELNEKDIIMVIYL